MHSPKPIIPWIGGKRRLADDLLPLFPAHTCYVEAFIGAGALYFMKEASDVEVINDINGELVNLYRITQYHLEEFVRQFKWAISSRQIYEWEQMKIPETMTDIQRAARFYYLQKQAFGGKVIEQKYGTATVGKSKLNLLRLEEDLSAAHLRLHGTYVENLSWEELFTRYSRPHTLFYLDPPYWETEGYGVDFDWGQYELMHQLMTETDSMVILSINAHPAIVELFSDMDQINVDINYTVGGKPSAARELIIRNDNCIKAGGNQTDLFAV